MCSHRSYGKRWILWTSCLPRISAFLVSRDYREVLSQEGLSRWEETESWIQPAQHLLTEEEREAREEEERKDRGKRLLFVEHLLSGTIGCFLKGVDCVTLLPTLPFNSIYFPCVLVTVYTIQLWDLNEIYRFAFVDRLSHVYLIPSSAALWGPSVLESIEWWVKQNRSWLLTG